MQTLIEKFITFGRNSESVDETLSKPDCTLENVLDDENLVEELRNPSHKLSELYYL